MSKQEQTFRTRQAVLKAIQGHEMIRPSDRVLVALSGGADSVCLFRVLLSLRDELSVSLAAVHVNHMIRSTADRDEAFVAALCDSFQVPLFIRKADVPAYAGEHGIGLEEAARILRYEAFEEAAKEWGATRIAIAHHEDDQAETVLFHLCRGCSLSGLGGMQPVRDDYIRPLLDIGRGEIENYLDAIGQSYMTDETNEDTQYARNLLRGRVLPLLNGEICEQSSSHISQTAEDMRLLESFVESQADEAYARCAVTTGDGRIEVKVETLRSLHPYLRPVIIKRCICNVSGMKRDIARIHVTDALALMKRQTGKRVSLPYGITAERSYESIVFFCADDGEAENEDWEISLLAGGEGALSEKKAMLPDGRELTARVFARPSDGIIPTKAYTKWLDYAKIKESLVVRTWRQGDYFFFDDSHRKSVRDHFKDEKMPMDQRRAATVVADGDHAVYIIGGRISSACKVTDETKTILEITVS